MSGLGLLGKTEEEGSWVDLEDGRTYRFHALFSRVAEVRKGARMMKPLLVSAPQELLESMEL